MMVGLATLLLGCGGAAFLVSGIVFTVVSNNKASSANAKLTELHATYGNTPCLAAKAAGACAATIAAVTYAVWPAPKQAPRTGIQLAPVLGDRMGGIVISGKF